MVPLSKKIGKKLAVISDTSNNFNRTKVRYISTNKEELFSAINNSKVKQITSPQDLLLNNALHGAAKISSSQNQFLLNVEKIMTEFAAKLKITGVNQNQKSFYIKTPFEMITRHFYPEKGVLRIITPQEFNHEQILEERRMALLDIRRINNYLPRKFSEIRGAVFVREQNLAVFGYETYYVKDQELLSKMNTLNYIFFIFNLPKDELFHKLMLAYSDIDQKGCNLETRKIVFPQYVTAQKVAETFNWVLEANPRGGQGDYVIKDKLTGEQKLLEIKITDKIMTEDLFEKHYVDLLSKFKKAPDNPMVLLILLASGFEGKTSENLTEMVENFIKSNRPYLRGKVEAKVINLIEKDGQIK